MNISIVNETENDLIVSTPSIQNNVVILSGEKKDVPFDTVPATFSVKKQYIKLSNIQKVFSYLGGAVIGALLCLIYYSQIESLKDSVKFTVNFFVSKEIFNENTIIKLRDTSTSELCSAQIDGMPLKSEVLISRQALSEERKEYYESNITMFVVPVMTVFVLSVMAVAYFKTATVTIIAVAVDALLFAPLLVIVLKNRVFYKRLYNEINTD